MLIKDIVKHLENGGSLKELSTEGTKKLMPLKRLSKAMKTAGYESQNKGGKAGGTWQFVGKDEPPLEKSIFEFDSSTLQRKRTARIPQQERINTVSTTYLEEKKNATPTDVEEINNRDTMERQDHQNVQTTQVPVFTTEEIATLKDIIATWNETKGTLSVMETAATPTTDQPLLERVRNIKQEKKMRKTLSINETVGKALDEFARRERVYKADVIELALWDFMERYSNRE